MSFACFNWIDRLVERRSAQRCGVLWVARPWCSAVFERSFSCRLQVHPAFEIPTHAFELQFQPVGFVSDVADSAVAGAAFPPAEYFFNPAAHPAQQPVDAHGGGAQFVPASGFAQNAVGNAPLSTPLAAGGAP